MPEQTKEKFAQSSQTRVVISVISKELTDHRAAVIESVNKLGITAVYSDPETAKDAAQEAFEAVDQADIYIGLLGLRYGYVPRTNNPDDRSLAELQYHRAMSRGLPMILCMMAEEVKLTGRTAELEAISGAAAKYRKRMEQFRTEVIAAHGNIYRFYTVEQVRVQVETALQRLTKRELPPDAVEMLNQISLHHPRSVDIPNHPVPYYPYPVLRSPQFFGRAGDIGAIDEWLSNDNTPVLILEGRGGVGKTALAAQWIHQRTSAGIAAGLFGIVFWRFHESDAIFSSFIRRTYAYISGQPLEAITPLSNAECERLLLQALRKRRYLIVMDGLERLLGSYFRMDAAYMTETQGESFETVPPNSPLRRPADPTCAAFLSQLANSGPSKIMITTRLAPSILGKGVALRRVEGLDTPEALQMANSLGLRGDSKTLGKFLADIGGTPLIINVLAGLIKSDMEGNFNTFYETHGPIYEPLDDYGKRDLVVALGLNALPREGRELIDQIGAFRHPVNTAALLATSARVPAAPPKVNEPRRWRADYGDAKAAYDGYLATISRREEMARAELPHLIEVLHLVEERGLLLWDHEVHRFDLHPVIRGVAHTLLERDKRAELFRRVRDYYEAQPIEKPAKSLSDLQPLIEVYNTLIASGQINAAADYYRINFGKASLANLATSYQVIELLRGLFPAGPRSLPALSNPKDQGFFTNELALMLGYVGQTGEALSLLEMTISVFAQEGEAPSLCAALIHYAGLLRDEHQMAAKIRAFELARDLASSIGDDETLAVAHLFLLKSYVDNGQWEKAHSEYDAFKRVSTSSRTAYRQATAERVYAKMLVCQGQDPTMALNLAWEMATAGNSVAEQRAIHALWGETSLQQNRADAAEKFFQAAIDLTPGQNPSLPNFLGGLARAQAKQGKLEAAKATLNQGISRSAAAEVYLALGERERARVAALDGYRTAWADGPPFTFWWELNQARQVLTTLGEAEPPLKPFDPSGVRQVPNEVEIHALIDNLRTQKTPRRGPISGMVPVDFSALDDSVGKRPADWDLKSAMEREKTSPKPPSKQNPKG
jgi:tetratricopeptide (TPR) repeat protein